MTSTDPQPSKIAGPLGSDTTAQGEAVPEPHRTNPADESRLQLSLRELFAWTTLGCLWCALVNAFGESSLIAVFYGTLGILFARLVRNCPLRLALAIAVAVATLLTMALIPLV